MSSYWLERTSSLSPAPGASAEALPEEAEVVVVGAGITGLVTGLLLARAGRQVVVLEARRVGAVTTGHTTGKVSLLQGTKLSRLLDQQPEAAVRRYLEANREGQAWLLRFCDEAALGAERRTAMTYAASAEQGAAAEAEHRAAQHLGLTTRWVERPDLPFPAFGAVALDDQAQLDPMAVLTELVRELGEHGGTLIEGERVVRIGAGATPVVHTHNGLQIRADDVVLATGTPIVDRGAHFARLDAQRSYVALFSGVQAPSEMLLSAGAPTRSVREVTEDGASLLMVGGSGHGVGRTTSERRHLDDLRAWTARHFPGAQETHRWSAQDYRSHDGLPHVGTLPLGGHHLQVATGFDKWGLTNGVAAALQLSAELLGGEMPWAPRRSALPRASAATTAVCANLEVGARLAGGWAAAEAKAVPEDLPEGSGVVGRHGLDPRPVATARVAGRLCQVSGVCTHLGGILRWNDAESSWDCPLHGSRFSADGAVLEGPATRPLAAAPADAATRS
ncbi:FAD-dependent oxidoreductase [Nocardioides dubius]